MKLANKITSQAFLHQYTEARHSYQGSTDDSPSPTDIYQVFLLVLNALGLSYFFLGLITVSNENDDIQCAQTKG